MWMELYSRLCILWCLLYVGVPDNFDMTHFGLLCSKLNDITAQYDDFGIQLGIDIGTIEKFEKKVVDVKTYLSNMLHMWYRENKPLKGIIEAIRCPINNKRLANKLENEWKEKGYCELYTCVVVLIFLTYIYSWFVSA